MNAAFYKRMANVEHSLSTSVSYCLLYGPGDDYRKINTGLTPISPQSIILQFILRAGISNNFN
jgi:hypothetical protein